MLSRTVGEIVHRHLSSRQLAACRRSPHEAIPFNKDIEIGERVMIGDGWLRRFSRTVHEDGREKPTKSKEVESIDRSIDRRTARSSDRNQCTEQGRFVSVRIIIHRYASRGQRNRN